MKYILFVFMILNFGLKGHAQDSMQPGQKTVPDTSLVGQPPSKSVDLNSKTKAKNKAKSKKKKTTESKSPADN